MTQRFLRITPDGGAFAIRVDGEDDESPRIAFTVSCADCGEVIDHTEFDMRTVSRADYEHVATVAHQLSNAHRCKGQA